MFKSFGRLLFKNEMIVAYDGNCKRCRRTVRTLKFFDVFGRIRFVSIFDEKALKEPELSGFDLNTLLTHMHAIMGKKSWKGFYAYRAISWRIPILWLTLPFLYVWPITLFGRKIYQHVADSRTCEIKKPESGS